MKNRSLLALMLLTLPLSGSALARGVNCPHKPEDSLDWDERAKGCNVKHVARVTRCLLKTPAGDKIPLEIAGTITYTSPFTQTFRGSAKVLDYEIRFLAANCFGEDYYCRGHVLEGFPNETGGGIMGNNAEKYVITDKKTGRKKTFGTGTDAGEDYALLSNQPGRVSEIACSFGDLDTFKDLERRLLNGR